MWDSRSGTCALGRARVVRGSCGMLSSMLNISLCAGYMFCKGRPLDECIPGCTCTERTHAAEPRMLLVVEMLARLGYRIFSSSP